jgi:UDP-GlcNAc3NAcA epimerase
MKIVTVIGARPQFIKAAVLSRSFKNNGITELLVHTGQHYDANMSDIFFDELEISKPSYNLEVGSGNHGQQTGAMLTGIEKILLDEKPDWVLVYGDTNSTLAGALAASKLLIKVAHVEAGLRSFNRLMPEEINRLLTDHISDLLFCPSNISVTNLSKEGITKGVFEVGDLMFDAVNFAVEKNKSRNNVCEQLNLVNHSYILVTLHRAETTDYPGRLASLLDVINNIQEDVVFPVHPRTRKAIKDLNFDPAPHVHLIEPVGYFDMIQLEKSARLIMTDSGGIQKEAYWLEVPCLTLRAETEWVETVHTGWNKIVGYDKNLIHEALKQKKVPALHPLIYCKPDCANQIVTKLVENC